MLTAFPLSAQRRAFSSACWYLCLPWGDSEPPRLYDTQETWMWIRITGKSFRNTDSQAPTQTYWVRISGNKGLVICDSQQITVMFHVALLRKESSCLRRSLADGLPCMFHWEPSSHPFQAWHPMTISHDYKGLASYIPYHSEGRLYFRISCRAYCGSLPQVWSQSLFLINICTLHFISVGHPIYTNWNWGMTVWKPLFSPTPNPLTNSW